MQRLDRRGGGPGDDVHVGAVGDQQRQSALRDAAAADDDDFPAVQPQADEVGVLVTVSFAPRVRGHPASLEAAAAATKRVTACGWRGRVGVQVGGVHAAVDGAVGDRARRAARGTPTPAG